MPVSPPITLSVRLAFKTCVKAPVFSTWMMVSIDLHGISITSFKMRAFNDNVFIIVRVTMSTYLRLDFGMASFKVQTTLRPRPN